MGYVYTDPLRLVGKPPVGSQECAAIPQFLVPGLIDVRVAHWRRGQQVKGSAIAPGTVIAIFDSNGDYIGTGRHNYQGGTAHTALYVRQSPEGIEVVHQFQNCGHIRGALIRFGGGRPVGHTSGVSLTPSGSELEDNADEYYVVEKR